MELPERKIYQVSEFTEKIREILETEYPSVWIQGEISNFRSAPSGHMYFTLKDDTAQIRCVMFRLQGRFLKFRPEDGLQIIAWGRLSVYGLRGEYQLILDTMEPSGFGSLMLAFEQLKTKLAAEGLFDENRKKPLPPFPKTIGLVTSPRGAVVRDMIRIIRHRAPWIHIVVSPSSVQGDKAPEEIRLAIQRLCQTSDVDVIILGRGGGPIEDLWAFNDERVVRAVAGCRLPIISAVGHETDVTLTDFVADLRAPTPSAAAQMLVSDKRDLEAALEHFQARLRHCVTAVVDRFTSSLGELLRRLHDPLRQISEYRMRIDDLNIRLIKTTKRKVHDLRREADSLAARLKPEHVARIVGKKRDQFDSLFGRFAAAGRASVRDAQQSFNILAGQLDGLSPLGILARGYSITFDSRTGAVIKDARETKPGEEVRIRLHRGELDCEITRKRDDI
ncbi:MAG: exodeoxyribonuclease VII large subunit [Syntrophales bacterium]